MTLASIGSYESYGEIIDNIYTGHFSAAGNITYSGYADSKFSRFQSNAAERINANFCSTGVGVGLPSTPPSKSPTSNRAYIPSLAISKNKFPVVDVESEANNVFYATHGCSLVSSSSGLSVHNGDFFRLPRYTAF